MVKPINPELYKRILNLIAQGKTSREIQEALHCSPNTIVKAKVWNSKTSIENLSSIESIESKKSKACSSQTSIEKFNKSLVSFTNVEIQSLLQNLFYDFTKL